ncbi:hypothetical protein C84B14_00030 [Salinisphaera sp. C84B14]
MIARPEVRYLEIGCDDDVLFFSVCAEYKTGVDPARGGTHRMTSDEFFAQNEDSFDVVFIDGLHEYAQVRADAINALAVLSEGGYIAFHDLLPSDWKQQHVPRLQASWTGDCWKAAVELAHAEGVDFRIIRIDQGVGVMRRTGGPVHVPDMSAELAHATFDDFAALVDNLPIIEWADFRRWSSRQTVG